jgi:hypothetical protein
MTQKQVGIFLREIFADNGYDFDFRKVARGQRDIGSGSAQHAGHFSVRSLDTVVRDGSNNDKGHCFIVLKSPPQPARASLASKTID